MAGTWQRQELAVAPASPVWRFLDLLYAPFIYLVPQSGFALAHNLLWTEAVARTVGPLVPLIGLFWLARRKLLTGAADLLIRHGACGHAVILGDHGSADALAGASAQAGEVVVLADPSVFDEEDRLAKLGAAGVICLAALPSRLTRAGTIALWRKSDVDNIAGALALRAVAHLTGREIHIGVQSPELHRTLLQAPDLMSDQSVRLRPYSLNGAAVRGALAGPDLPAQALTCGQLQVTLCLWGTGEALTWAAEMALRQFWSAHLGPPRVLWVHEGKMSLPSALAHFALHASTVFPSADRPVLRQVSAEEACYDHDVTCHLVADDPDTSVSQAYALAGRLRQAFSRPPPVQPVLEGTRNITLLFAESSLAFRPPIAPGAALTLDALRDRPADEAAARIHLAYCRDFGGEGSVPASGRWQDLPETYVAANRAAADHAAIKRWDAATSPLEREPLIEALARAEHNRWCAERLLAGWAPARQGLRDDARRLHPDLRSWEALEEEVQEKDRSQVRLMITGQMESTS